MQKTLLDSYQEAINLIKRSKRSDSQKETAVFYYRMNLIEYIGNSFASFEKGIFYTLTLTTNKAHQLIVLGKYLERCFFEEEYERCKSCYDLLNQMIKNPEEPYNPLFAKEIAKILQIIALSYYKDEEIEQSKELLEEALNYLCLTEKNSVDMRKEKEILEKCLQEISYDRQEAI